MSYDISMAAERIQLDVVHQALANSYWSPKLRRDILARAIENSLVIGAYDQGTDEQIGFARVVTDYATFAWLCDVWVAESRRGGGIGKRMIEELLHHSRLQSLRRWCLATKDAHGLYERFGFRPVPGERWLEMRLPETTWRALG